MTRVGRNDNGRDTDCARASGLLWTASKSHLDTQRCDAEPVARSSRSDSPPRADMIEIRDVSKLYSHFRALDGCTTSVAKGSVVVVCGPSGSGKSTLIRCINGLERIDGGEIIVDGISVHAPG